MALAQGLTKLNTVAHNYQSFNNGIAGFGKNQTNFDLYKDDSGNYFLERNGNYIQLDTSKLNDSTLNSLKKNTAVSIPLSSFGNDFVKSVYNGTAPVVPLPTPKRTVTETTNTTTKTSGGGGGGGGNGDAALYARLNSLTKQLEELKKPNVMSADEIAALYGWDYNLDNIRANFDEKTRQYYDDLIAQQEQYRTDYVADNARYNRNIYNNYVDSYRNAAQTRSGKALRSANLLSSMINADQLNSENDYGMLQSVNNLREAQKAEYENNPYLAEQAYNTLGTYASQLSANLNASQVQQYADKLTALANMYSAERQYQGYLAQGAAQKYSGLANAAVTNAQANALSTLDNYYNYYKLLNNQLSTTNSDYYANRNVANLINNTYKTS